MTTERGVESDEARERAAGESNDSRTECVVQNIDYDCMLGQFIWCFNVIRYVDSMTADRLS